MSGVTDFGWGWTLRSRLRSGLFVCFASIAVFAGCRDMVVPEQEISAGTQQTTPPVQKAAPVVEATPVAATRPQQQAAPVVTTTAKPPAGSYYLQVGSFKNAAQAERFKAELAMQGLQTSIQKVTINNKDTFHRVRSGPYKSRSRLNELRTRLQQNSIKSMVIRLKQ